MPEVRPDKKHHSHITATSLHHHAEAAAARLPALMIAAERVASTIAQGVHGRRRIGQGEAFWQFRPYADGDATSRIDWRQSAKSDRVYVRETEWEAAQSVWIARDPSGSMDYRSSPELPTKRERADLIALAIAVLLIRGGEHIALHGSGSPPRTGRATLTRLATRLTNNDGTMPDAGSESVVPRHGTLIAIGDFLEPREAISDMLREHAARGVRGHIVHIIDPAEAKLPFEGRVRYEGLEGERALLIGRTESVRDDYRQFFADRIEAVRSFATQAGWRYDRHITERPVEPTLLGLYTALSKPERSFAHA